MAYTYSDAGDLLSLTQNFTSSGDTFHTTLTYTDAHQLETEDIGKPAYVWQPAANGTDSYGAANDVNQYPSVHFAGVSNQTYTYDNKANLQNDGTFAYLYNPENLLMSATSTATAASYAYDPLGRRQQKVVNGTSTWFLNDGDTEIAEYNNAGNLARRYIPGPAIDDYIEVIPTTGSAKFFHTDHHGSVVAMSGPTGAPLEGPYVYDAYGTCNVGGTDCAADGTGQPYRFTGQRLDNETGLYYYRARYYSSKLGRFLQTDPVGYKDDLNLYTYAGNDPTDKTDPTGQVCVGANGWSDYCRRSELYRQFDAKFSGQTRFFGAASMTTAMLADLDLFPAQAMASSSLRNNMSSISSELEVFNMQEARALENGRLNGAHLDEDLVHNEQSRVQGYLNGLATSDPVEYAKFIAEANGLLNPTGLEGAAASVYSSDAVYQGVLSDVRRQLGRNIDFGNQKDREAVGSALIGKLRKSGGCAVPGSRIQRC